ncbi:MAG: FAD-binding oxidoreductase [Actinomycetes bacterium]
MTAVTPDAQIIDELTAELSGEVYQPQDEGYDAERSGFGLYHTHTPNLIVAATSTDDVVAAVTWAAANGMSIAVMSTGHGSVSAYQDCLLINTSRMNSVAIDPVARTAKLGAGVRWRDVLPAAHELGLATINGSSSGVGVVGYTTGGGAPVMGRTFGFSADNVVEFEIVTADGVVRRCTPDTETDLFWAVRGGKGNFGVVTSLTVNLVPVSTIYGGGLIYDGPAADQVFRAYAHWVETLPDEMTTSLALMRLPDLPFVPPPLAGKLTVHLRVAYVGDAAEGERLLAPMRELGAPIIIDGVAEMPYTRVDEIHRDPVDPLPVWESGITLRELSSEALDALLAAAGSDVEIPLVMVEVRHLGGAMSREPAIPNAVPGRSAKFSFWCLGPMFPGLDKIVPGVGHHMLDVMRPWAGEGRLLNFLGDATSKEEVAGAWPKATYDRLVAIKKQVDPQNLFRHGHALEPVINLPTQR